MTILREVVKFVVGLAWVGLYLLVIAHISEALESGSDSTLLWLLAVIVVGIHGGYWSGRSSERRRWLLHLKGNEFAEYEFDPHRPRS